MGENHRCSRCGDYVGGPDTGFVSCSCLLNRGGAGYHDAKRDQDKPRPSLLPWDGIGPVLEVAEFGARKYSPQSWRTVPDAEQRYAEAFRRHALACMVDASAVDEETGLPHVAHAAWNALALLSFAAGSPPAARRTEVPSTPVRKSPPGLDAMPDREAAPSRGATQATRFCGDCGSAYWTAHCLCGVE